MGLLICSYLYGQDQRDSLWSVWLNDSYDDSTRVWSLQRYSWHYFLAADPDSAYKLAELSFQFAHERNLLYFMGFARLGQGVSYQLRGNKVKALDLFLESIPIFEAANSLSGVAEALNNIGLMYFDMHEYDRALDYHRQSLAMRIKSKDGLGTSGSFTNIGDVYLAKEDYETALEYYDKSLLTLDSIGRVDYKPNTLDNIGVAYLKMGDYERAKGFFNSCLELSENEPQPLICMESRVRLGEIGLKQAMFDEARKECQEAFRIAVSTKNLDWQLKACDCLYESYKGLKQPIKALKYLELSKMIQDSLATKDLYQRLQDMELRKELVLDSLNQYERDRQANLLLQEEVRKRNRTRDLWIVSGVITLLVFGGFWSRLNYIRKSKETLEKAKKQSDKLLLNILPAEIAEELKETGKASARQYEQVSILFTDFEKFTETSELLSASDLVAEVNYCFEEFDRICEAYGIEKIKTIGDAYMAAGGLPVPENDSTRNTIMAALKMQAFISERKNERKIKGLPAFEMRAGIHTGPVVAGIVGLKKFQYDVWGDTVNTANRMESYSDTGRVNISEFTFNLVKSDPAFEFKIREVIDVKGKGQMKMYYVFMK